MGRVLILDCEAKPALVAIRSLGARGLSVTAGSSKPWNAGRVSKYTDRYLECPSFEEDPDEFVRVIEQELKARNYDMLLPVNEDTVEVVLENSERLAEHASIPFLPLERLRVGLNKRRTIEAAREFDIPHPKTLFSDETDYDTAEQVLGYPIVVKPPRGRGRNDIAVCDSRKQLERTLERTRSKHGPVLLQEFVPRGSECGVYTLYDDSGELTGLTVQRRLRSNPPEGGASTYRETIDDPELVELSDRFLTALDWRGVAMVEFRIDSRTGEPKLLEINPRLWGSLALSVYAGVDFPYLLYQLAVGEEPERSLDYAVGVRCRCLFMDGLQVLAREDRLRALREFFTPSEKPCRHDIVSWRDPIPTFGQIAYWLDVLSDGGFSGPFESDDESKESILPRL